jgi:hypothetical protein
MSHTGCGASLGILFKMAAVPADDGQVTFPQNVTNVLRAGVSAMVNANESGSR